MELDKLMIDINAKVVKKIDLLSLDLVLLGFGSRSEFMSRRKVLDATRKIAFHESSATPSQFLAQQRKGIYQVLYLKAACFSI